MSKGKLTIENTELDMFKSCVDLAGMRVLEVQNLGTLDQVVVYYKTEQQLITCGRYMEKLLNRPTDVQDIQDPKPVKKAISTKKKIKS